MACEKTSIAVESGYIKVTIKNPSSNPFTQYAYYLYGEKGLLQKTPYVFVDYALFEIENIDTTYSATVFIRTKNSDNEEYRKKTVKTDSIRVFSTNTRDEYDKFLYAEKSKINYQLPYSKSQYPYQDILLIQELTENNSTNKNLFSDLGLKHKEFGNCHIYVSDKFSDTKEGTIAFSGMTRVDDKFIYGYNDFYGQYSFEEIKDNIGSFLCVEKHGSKISLNNDYFGAQKWYYYRDDKRMITSNRYHLVLLAMRYTGVAKYLNMDKVYTYLGADNQLLMQQCTRELNINGCFILPCDSRLVFDAQTNMVEIEKTELFYDLSAPLRYSEEKYEEYLNKAKEELLFNASAIVKCEHFDQVVFDVTAGLDSRIVAATLSNFEKFKDKIFPHTASGDKYKEDIDIGIKVISKTPFNFGKIKYEDIEQRDIDCEGISHILGTTAEYPVSSKRYAKGAMLPGFYGEVTCRPYYSMNMILDKKVDTFTDSYCLAKMVIRQSILNLDCGEKLRQMFAREIEMLPGRSVLEKYENQYLYYRNGLHANDAFRSSVYGPVWNICQSKNMLKLKYMIYPQDSIKPQLDILYKMNSEIASVPLSERNNTLRDELNKKYNMYPRDNTFDEKRIQELTNEFLANKSTGNSKTIRDFQKKYFSNREILLTILHILVNDYGFDREIGLQIFWFIKHSESKRFNYFAKKFISLYFEISC